ncbi:hypothetical protein [Egicoccus sp. AB-alg6-2]|uniref:hypothetical protein n=1 Tax=Egicoccus sp. AB-alg6-2 TaxID=3242692 RepID=UPI00359D878E
MINLNTAAGPAATGLTGPQADAAAGDFLAVLAALVTDATSAVGPDGTGVLLPGSPLLERDSAPVTGTDEAAPGPSGSPLAAAPADAEADAYEHVPAWPTLQALAAMCTRPTADTDPATPVLDEAPVTTAPATVSTPRPIAPAAVALATGDPVATTTEGELDHAVETSDDPSPAGDEPPAMGAPAQRLPANARALGLERHANERAVTETAEPRPAAAVDGGRPMIDAPEVRRPEMAARQVRIDAGTESVTETMTQVEPGEPGESERTAPTSTAAGISRVLDALEQLELAPPPRRVTLELGDVRVRLSLEDGAVRMHLLGEQRDEQGREFLRAANEALRERGFSLADQGRGHARDGAPGQQRPDLAPPRPERGTARINRPVDTTTAGVRSGIHL